MQILIKILNKVDTERSLIGNIVAFRGDQKSLSVSVASLLSECDSDIESVVAEYHEMDRSMCRPVDYVAWYLAFPTAPRSVVDPGEVSVADDQTD